jgi:hypothetical protein
MGCSTLGRSERIRVPFPAAKITTFNDMVFPSIIETQ